MEGRGAGWGGVELSVQPITNMSKTRSVLACACVCVGGGGLCGGGGAMCVCVSVMFAVCVKLLLTVYCLTRARVFKGLKDQFYIIF